MGPSGENQADFPYRELSRAGARLTASMWHFLQRELGGSSGFSWGLTTLLSNVPKGRFPVPGSSGVNVFAQSCPQGEQLYVFPPFVLIPALIKLFIEWGVCR